MCALRKRLRHEPCIDHAKIAVSRQCLHTPRNPLGRKASRRVSMVETYLPYAIFSEFKNHAKPTQVNRDLLNGGRQWVALCRGAVFDSHSHLRPPIEMAS